jgi:hypothetical protein
VQSFVSETGKVYLVVRRIPQLSGFSIGGVQITSMAVGVGPSFDFAEANASAPNPDPVLHRYRQAIAYLPLSNLIRTAIETGLPSNVIVEDQGSPLNGDFDPPKTACSPCRRRSNCELRRKRDRTSGFRNPGNRAGVTLVPAAAVLQVERQLGATRASGPVIVFRIHLVPRDIDRRDCVGGTTPGAPCDPANGNAGCEGAGTCTNFGARQQARTSPSTTR